MRQVAYPTFLNSASSPFQVCDDFFRIACSLLNFARVLLGFQIGVTRNFSDLLPDCSLHAVETAFDLVFRAGFHILPSPSQSADWRLFETVLKAATFLISRLSEV